MTKATFDPATYKNTTRAQWEAAAGAWDRWGPTLEAWLGPATDRMLDLCGVAAGAHVLDVAAGAGGQTVAAARRVGPDGHVLATDISPGILAYAARRAAAAGLGNVATRELDGEDFRVSAGQFDAVISWVGLIYFPNQAAALAGMRAALRPGGRIGAIVYGTAEDNEFSSVPVGIIRRRAELPPPAPGQPGPFSLGRPGVLRSVLVDAGFDEVTVEEIDAPLHLPSSSDCVRFEQESFGALHQMLAGLGAAAQAAAWAEVAQALVRFDGPGGFTGPCRMLIAAGTRRRSPYQRRDDYATTPPGARPGGVDRAPHD